MKFPTSALPINECESAEISTLLNGSVLVVAAQRGYRTVAFDFFLDNYCPDINTADENGDSAAHIAARSGNLSLLEYLFDKGANVAVANNSGECIALAAAAGGDLNCKNLTRCLQNQILFQGGFCKHDDAQATTTNAT